MVLKCSYVSKLNQDLSHVTGPNWCQEGHLPESASYVPGIRLELWQIHNIIIIIDEVRPCYGIL